MSESPFIVTFPGVSPAEANRYAAGLAGALRDVDRDIKAERRRDRGDTQDFGATLAITLGSASATGQNPVDTQAAVTRTSPFRPAATR